VTSSVGASGVVGGVVDGDGDGAKKATEAGSGPVLRAGKSQPYRRKQTHDNSKEDISRRVTVTYPSFSNPRSQLMAM
jgi:hypothetical protein